MIATKARPHYERVRPENLSKVLKRWLPHEVSIAACANYDFWTRPITKFDEPFCRTMGDDWSPAHRWCHENIGPSVVINHITFKGNPYAQVCNNKSPWGNSFGHFFFRNITDAIWFKFVWHCGQAQTD